jgi:hypothetical protein
MGVGGRVSNADGEVNTRDGLGDERPRLPVTGVAAADTGGADSTVSASSAEEELADSLPDDESETAGECGDRRASEA